VADNFIEKGELIVSRKGRSSNSNEAYEAKTTPIWRTEPMVVLVDTFSASASEIVAGAIQDLDRGLIVGSPTFGKGLVQTVVPISKETALRITTSKYYIPSGRPVQKPGIYRNNKVLLTSSDDKTDSTIVYKTAAGRTVKENGGIHPDVKVKSKPMPMIIRQMIMKSMFFNFSLEFTSQHPDLERDFEIDENIIDEYKAFLKLKKFKYKTEDEEKLEGLEKIADEEGYKIRANSALSELRKIVEEEKKKDFGENIDYIKWYLKAEIAGKLWGTAAKTEAGFDRSPEIQKAVEILSNTDKYYAVLQSRKVEK
jgi:carboxyl-terminal processing protease